MTLAQFMCFVAFNVAVAVDMAHVPACHAQILLDHRQRDLDCLLQVSHDSGDDITTREGLG